MSAASRSTPARASWPRPSLEACLSPEPLKISCQAPELIFKIMVSTSSKVFPTSGDSSWRTPDSAAKRRLENLRVRFVWVNGAGDETLEQAWHRVQNRWTG